MFSCKHTKSLLKMGENQQKGFGKSGADEVENSNGDSKGWGDK